MKWLWLCIGLLFLVACQQAIPVCTDPYIVHANDCCLDRDGDAICDADVTVETAGEFDCSLCAPQFITEKEEVIVYKYVCYDQEVVDDPAECVERIESNAHLFSVNNLQNDSIVNTFKARAACRGKYQAAEFNVKVSKTPQKIVLQYKNDPNGGYHDLHTLNGTSEILDDEYLYIGFCDTQECTLVMDSVLPATTAYVFRAKLQYAEEFVFTKDQLVDPTPDGEYGQQRC